MKTMLSIALFSLHDNPVFVSGNFGFRILDCGFKEFYQFLSKMIERSDTTNPQSAIRNLKFLL